jgi:hypothetical protein
MLAENSHRSCGVQELTDHGFGNGNGLPKRRKVHRMQRLRSPPMETARQRAELLQIGEAGALSKARLRQLAGAASGIGVSDGVAAMNDGSSGIETERPSSSITSGRDTDSPSFAISNLDRAAFTGFLGPRLFDRVADPFFMTVLNDWDS